MSQITLYLDDATEASMNRAVQASGLSKSRWVAELIRSHARDTWPAEVSELAGAFPDFPLIETALAQDADVERVGF